MNRSSVRIVCVFLAAAVFAAGCGVAPPNPVMLPAAQAARPQLLPAVAVVPVREVPESKLAIAPPDRMSATTGGALQGATRGAFIGLEIGGMAVAMNPFAILALPGLVGATGLIGLLVGAVGGNIGLVSPEKAAEVQDAISAGLAGYRASESAARSASIAMAKTGAFRSDLVVDGGPDAANSAPNYRELGSGGFDLVFEIRVRRIDFSQASVLDPEVALIVAAEARLVDAATGVPIATRSAGYQSPRRHTTVWANDGAQLLRAELDHAHRVLGERLADLLLFGVEWSPTARVGFGTGNNRACGLIAVAPPPPWGIFKEGPGVAPVDTLAPVLTWATFPSAEMKESDAALDRATSVSYDVRIWRASDIDPPALVYERWGLPSSTHRVEEELRPATGYLWSVRARYVVDGQPRAIRWSASELPYHHPSPELRIAAAGPRATAAQADPFSCKEPLGQHANLTWTPCKCVDFIPQPNYYRFKTP